MMQTDLVDRLQEWSVRDLGLLEPRLLVRTCQFAISQELDQRRLEDTLSTRNRISYRLCRTLSELNRSRHPSSEIFFLARSLLLSRIASNYFSSRHPRHGSSACGQSSLPRCIDFFTTRSSCPIHLFSQTHPFLSNHGSRPFTFRRRPSLLSRLRRTTARICHNTSDCYFATRPFPGKTWSWTSSSLGSLRYRIFFSGSIHLRILRSKSRRRRRDPDE